MVLFCKGGCCISAVGGFLAVEPQKNFLASDMEGAQFHPTVERCLSNNRVASKREE